MSTCSFWYYIANMSTCSLQCLVKQFFIFDVIHVWGTHSHFENNHRRVKLLMHGLMKKVWCWRMKNNKNSHILVVMEVSERVMMKISPLYTYDLFIQNFGVRIVSIVAYPDILSNKNDHSYFQDTYILTPNNLVAVRSIFTCYHWFLEKREHIWVLILCIKWTQMTVHMITFTLLNS